MAEWHVTPDYIENNWTNELLNLMIEKLEKRKDKEKKAIHEHTDSQTVSDKDFFRQLGNKVRVIKHGN